MNKNVAIGILLTLSSGLFAIEAQKRFGNDLTLYCSFDNEKGLKSDSKLNVPSVSGGMQRWVQTGQNGLYPAVDFSLNKQPLLYQWNLNPVPDGQYKEAVRMQKTDENAFPRLAIDAIGNIFPDKGAISLWSRWEKNCPPTKSEGVLFSVNALRLPHEYLRYLTVKFERGTTLNVSVVDRFGTEHSISCTSKRYNLQAEKWHHFAINWDEKLGLELYIDGKLRASSWGKDSWHTRTNLATLTLGHLPGEGIGLGLGSYKSWSPDTILDFDELSIYKRPLNEKEVMELFAGNRINNTQKYQDDLEKLYFHRMKMMGWEKNNMLPEIRIYPANEKMQSIRQLEIKEAKVIKLGTHIPFDGQWHTLWPLEYESYSDGDKDLTLKFSKQETYNYCKLTAPEFKGGLYDILAQKHAICEITSISNPFRWIQFSSTLKNTGVTLNRLMGKISEVSFFEIGASDNKEKAYEEKFIPVSCTQDILHPPSSKRLGKFSAATLFSDNADRNVIAFKKSENAENCSVNEFTIPAGRFIQFSFPVAKKKQVYSGLKFDLQVKNLFPSKMWMGWFDPILQERFLWEFDCQLLPDTGTERLSLSITIPGMVILPGENLNLMFLTDKELTVINKEGRKSAVYLVENNKPEVVSAYYENQLGYLKDCFRTLSEGRSWIVGGEPFKAFRFLARNLTALETLARINENDWRPGGIWNYLHDQDKRKAPWINYTQPALYKTHDKLPQAPSNCPEWAFWWKETYQRLSSVVYWWIDNRQVENGELGGRYGDDTDMVHEWANFYTLWHPDEKLAKSFITLSDYCWKNKNKDGLTIYRNDSDLHCYEEGMNIHSACLIFRYGDPMFYNRTMLTAQHTDGNLTRMNAKGQRLQPCETYTGHRFDTRGKPVDTGIFFRMEPVLWLTWYNRHPEAVRLLREWMDTRLNYFPNKHPSGLPGTIRFEDGKDMTSSEKYMPSISFDTLYILTKATKDNKYLTPLIYNLKKNAKGENPIIGNYTPERWNIFSRFDAIGKSDWWPNVVKEMSTETPTPYGSPYKPETRTAMVNCLKDTVGKIQRLNSIFTWAEQSVDRIFFPSYPRGAFYWMSMGGTVRVRNHYPLPCNAVSYENADPEIARWVLSSGFDKLSIAFYNFHDKAVTIRILPWILDHGIYEISEGLASDDNFSVKGVLSRSEEITSMETFIPISLPPKKTYVWNARQTKRLPDTFDKPDIAVSRSEIEFIPSIPSLRIPVHNIGVRPAENIQVSVSDADTGNILWQKEISRIDPPLDFAPKTYEIHTGPLNLSPNVRHLKIAIDPQKKIMEFSRRNNEALIDTGVHKAACLQYGKNQKQELLGTKEFNALPDKPDLVINQEEVEFIAFIPSLRIPVRNMGKAPAENIQIHVIDPNTLEILWQKEILRIDPPLDSLPKTYNLYTGRLELPKNTKQLKVVIDPLNKTDDFSRRNNDVIINLPAS